MNIFNKRSFLIFFIGVFCFCLSVLASAQAIDNNKIVKRTWSISNANQYGNFDIYGLKNWTFSFDSPQKIKDTLNLINSAIQTSLYDISEVKKLENWNNYGWFELEFNADSTLGGLPFTLLYRSLEPVQIWFNGRLVLKAGNPSVDPAQEILARYVNPSSIGLILREGKNYFLIKYSSHGIRSIHAPRNIFSNGVYLSLVKPSEPFQRRERGFIFGGAILLLINLVLIHLFLAFRFKGSYHIYVALLTFFMLLHSFATLSDTLIDWTGDYTYFASYTYALAYIFVLYFFLISIRKYFELPVHWNLKNWILGILCLSGILIVKWDYDLLGYFHQLIMISTFTYGVFTLIKVWKKDKNPSVLIIATGLFLTVLGTFLYVGVYLLLGKQINWLFYLSILLSYTSIPIVLTLIVATSYAKLISTLENQVKERTAKLEASNEFQKRFFANISHEFKTPLTISEGLISKVLDKDLVQDESVRYDLWMSKRNMLRLHDMVNQVIELTKADHNQLILNKKNSLAAELVSISVESFRSMAEYHGHSFTYEPTTEEVVLFVDQSQTEIMINNLISNAIKFTPVGGTILIRTQVRDAFFVIQVIDNGPGIPEDKRDSIFERFHRLMQPNMEYIEGMGVGLELSKVIALLHNGDIKVFANEPIGSVFELILPISTQKNEPIVSLGDRFELVQKPSSETILAMVGGPNFKILLVEDNADLLHYISSIFVDLGTVEKAKNGRIALDLMEKYTPDIIITDLMMPEMGGIELIEQVYKNAKWKDIPIIVLSAKAIESEKLNLFRIGVVDYITKPFSAEQLLLKAKNLLTVYQNKKGLRIQITSDLADKTEQFSEKVAQFISENCSDSQLSVDSLANSFSMSRSTFYRNLLADSGMTPADFIREVRLSTAREMVAKDKSNLRLEVLANAVGYKSATSFRKMYFERFGEHPIS